MRSLVLFCLVALPACTSLVESPEALGEGSTGTDGPSSTSSDGPAATTMVPNPTVDPTTGMTTDPTSPTTTSPIDPGSTGGDESTSGSEDSCGFLGCLPDIPPAFECDSWDQDCPEGEKCNAWAHDGGSVWNGLRCVPIAPNPDGIDQPCFVEDSLTSGLDTCEFGAMCWDVDPDTLMGTCVPLCTGTVSAPSCADPNRYCITSGDNVLNLCLLQCDPLDPTSCDPGEGCYPSDSAFACAPDASRDAGGVFQSCAFTNGCDPGLLCAQPESSVACEGGNGCCIPYCDLQAPQCPAPTTCIPYFEKGLAPPQYVDVGVCMDG